MPNSISATMKNASGFLMGFWTLAITTAISGEPSSGGSEHTCTDMTGTRINPGLPGFAKVADRRPDQCCDECLKEPNCRAWMWTDPECMQDPACKPWQWKSTDIGTCHLFETIFNQTSYVRVPAGRIDPESWVPWEGREPFHFEVATEDVRELKTCYASGGNPCFCCSAHCFWAVHSQWSLAHKNRQPNTTEEDTEVREMMKQCIGVEMCSDIPGCRPPTRGRAEPWGGTPRYKFERLAENEGTLTSVASCYTDIIDHPCYCCAKWCKRKAKAAFWFEPGDERQRRKDVRWEMQNCIRSECEDINSGYGQCWIPRPGHDEEAFNFEKKQDPSVTAQCYRSGNSACNCCRSYCAARESAKWAEGGTGPPNTPAEFQELLENVKQCARHEVCNDIKDCNESVWKHVGAVEYDML